MALTEQQDDPHAFRRSQSNKQISKREPIDYLKSFFGIRPSYLTYARWISGRSTSARSISSRLIRAPSEAHQSCLLLLLTRIYAQLRSVTTASLTHHPNPMVSCAIISDWSQESIERHVHVRIARVEHNKLTQTPPAPALEPTAVVISDIHTPFWSMVTFMVKWALASNSSDNNFVLPRPRRMGDFSVWWD